VPRKIAIRKRAFERHCAELFGNILNLKKKSPDRKVFDPGISLFILGIFLETFVREGYSVGSGRSSDLRINLLTAPSHMTRILSRDLQWLFAVFVPDYSGGPIPVSHGVPY